LEKYVFLASCRSLDCLLFGQVRGFHKADLFTSSLVLRLLEDIDILFQTATTAHQEAMRRVQGPQGKLQWLLALPDEALRVSRHRSAWSKTRGAKALKAETYSVKPRDGWKASRDRQLTTISIGKFTGAQSATKGGLLTVLPKGTCELIDQVERQDSSSLLTSALLVTKLFLAENQQEDISIPKHVLAVEQLPGTGILQATWLVHKRELMVPFRSVTTSGKSRIRNVYRHSK
jgi:hypothetical protein